MAARSGGRFCCDGLQPRWSRRVARTTRRRAQLRPRSDDRLRAIRGLSHRGATCDSKNRVVYDRSTAHRTFTGFATCQPHGLGRVVVGTCALSAPRARKFPRERPRVSASARIDRKKCPHRKASCQSGLSLADLRFRHLLQQLPARSIASDRPILPCRVPFVHSRCKPGSSILTPIPSID